MKKHFGISLLLLAGLLLLSGCGETSQTALEILPCAEILSAVQESQTFSTEMKDVVQAQFLRYLAIEESQISDGAMAMDVSRETPEAIVILTASSQDHVQPLADALSLYLKDTMEEYRDYRPLEMPKLENAVQKTSGTQVALVIGSDETAAEAVLSEWMGE